MYLTATGLPQSFAIIRLGISYYALSRMPDAPTLHGHLYTTILYKWRACTHSRVMRASAPRSVGSHLGYDARAERRNARIDVKIFDSDQRVSVIDRVEYLRASYTST